MGNAEAAIVRNVDKRTSRRDHKPTFEAAVARFRANPFDTPPVATTNAAKGSKHSVRVCIRKRPIFPHEVVQGEFDVITSLAGRVVVHDARMHPDMVKMFMNHHDFQFDNSFSEKANNDDVYAGTARELVQQAANLGNATVMMYGQTGSGKTYTMSAIYQRVARDLFEECRSRCIVSVSFIELAGDQTFDMLNQGASLQLTTACDGSVHPYPCVEVKVENADDLTALIDMATKMRATAATGVHDQSSRSHALCRIYVEENAAAGEGCLTLVDLAGSEHRIDSAEHNAERRKEGAKINASLCALKDCIRSMAAGAKFIAFRQSKLTQLLRACFDSQKKHPTVVIATVSPSSKDTEHSLNTLRHACIMDGQGESKESGSAHLSGGVVTKEQLGSVDVTALARKRKEDRKKGVECTSDWGQPPPPPAHQAKQSNTVARSQLDRKCVQALPPRLRKVLLEARTPGIACERQRLRISKVQPNVEDSLVSADAPSASEEKKAAHTEHGQDPPPLASREGGRGRGPPSIVVDAWLPEGAVGGPEAGAGADLEKALRLFRIFCKDGRGGFEWRKNDLRLINTYVVPVFYGNARIQWQLPNVALDELEQLVAATPPSANLARGYTPELQTRSAKDAKLPPRPQSDDAQSLSKPSNRALPPAEQRNRRSRTPTPSMPPVTDAAPQNAPERGTPLKRLERHSGSSDLTPRAASAARAPSGPLVATASAASAAEAAFAADKLSTAAAVKARRERLEEQRQKSLQEALGRKTVPESREEEVLELERQLSSGNCSAAAAVGLKKRLAALKAAAIREERKASERNRLPHRDDENPSPTAHPMPPYQAPQEQHLGVGPELNALPEPAMVLPRAHVATLSSDTSNEGYAPPRGRGCVAASAPWANEFSTKGF